MKWEPRGLLILWREGVRGRAEPFLKSSPDSKANPDGRFALLPSA